MKRWQWFIAFFICLIVYFTNKYGQPTAQAILTRIVYTSDDLLWMRSLYQSLWADEDNVLIQVSYEPNLKVSEIQPFEEGFLIQLNETEVRARHSGIILYTGNTKKYGKLMTVYYDSIDLKVTYGFLKDIKQLPYVIVKPRDLVAYMNETEKIYIQIQRGEQILTQEETIMWLEAHD